jgi:hypothetical protein
MYVVEKVLLNNPRIIYLEIWKQWALPKMLEASPLIQYDPKDFTQVTYKYIDHYQNLKSYTLSLT